MMRGFFTLIFTYAFYLTGIAQDQTFTQFHNSPLFLNPSFTGSTLEFRAGLNSRIQWPALDDPFITNAFYGDYNIRNLNSGVGVSFILDNAGPLRASSLNLLYSYKINLNHNWVISAGLQYGYSTRNFNVNNFLFGSEILSGSQDPDFAGTSREQTDYFDFSGGISIFSRNFWFGISTFHLNTPNVAVTAANDPLDVQVSVHGGWRLKVSDAVFKKKTETYLLPSFIYRNQGDFDQLDVGFQVFLEPLVFGAWYRGLTIAQENSLQGNGTIAFLIGTTFEQFEVGYSYDILVNGIGTRTGGAHELSLIYQFKAIDRRKQLQKRQRRLYNRVPPFLREKWWTVD